MVDATWMSASFPQLKETRKSVQDSESGVQKMSIGHHIGEWVHEDSIVHVKSNCLLQEVMSRIAIKSLVVPLISFWSFFVF